MLHKNGMHRINKLLIGSVVIVVAIIFIVVNHVQDEISNQASDRPPDSWLTWNNTFGEVRTYVTDYNDCNIILDKTFSDEFESVFTMKLFCETETESSDSYRTYNNTRLLRTVAPSEFLIHTDNITECDGSITYDMNRDGSVDWIETSFICNVDYEE